MLCLKAEGSYEVTTTQILSRCGLPSPASLLAAARLRFLGQLTRHGPDPAWAILRWYSSFQRAAKEACQWLLQAVGSTSTLADPIEDWDSWRVLIVDRPGQWKGLLKRAEAWHAEVVTLQALMDSSLRSIWSPRVRPAPTLGLSACRHACLVCGLAFRTQQAWGAHAHRAHGYLSPAHTCAQGRRCPACGLTLANLTRLRKHFKTSPVCLQVAQGCFEVPTFPLDLSEAHIQLPASGGLSRSALPVAQQVLCHPLLAALGQLTAADDEVIYEIVQGHIEPLPVLRDTVQRWVDSLPDGALRSAGHDVLLILHAEHLCSRISGKEVPSLPQASGFVPEILPLVADLPVAPAAVAWLGCLCPRWVDFWGLASLPPFPLSWPLDPTLVLGRAAAMCCQIPDPPTPFPHAVEPTSCRLRVLRSHRQWLAHTLSAVELLFQRARAGTPVLLRLPVSREALHPLSEWLVQQAEVSSPTPSCFTLEFA